MKREEFFFDSRDGQSKIYAVRFSPEEGMKVRGIVQIVHGMCESIERYEKLASILTSKGFVVTGNDHLGHGRTGELTDSLGYFCRRDPATVVVRDVHRLKKKTEGAFPGVPYVILGHGMGSLLLGNYLLRYGSGINGAILLGTGMQVGGSLNISKALVRIQMLLGMGRKRAGLVDSLSFGRHNAQSGYVKSTADLQRGAAVEEKPQTDGSFPFTVNGFATLFELIDRLRNRDAMQMIPRELPLFMAAEADECGDGMRRAYEAMVAAGMDNIQMKAYAGTGQEQSPEAVRGEAEADICVWLENIVK